MKKEKKEKGKVKRGERTRREREGEDEKRGGWTGRIWKKRKKEDMREMGVRGWRRKTQDRRVWASLVKQTLTLQGS